MSSKPSWEQISRIFDQALDKPSGERGVWVAQQCEGNAVLLKEVEELLAAHEKAGGVLDEHVDNLATKVFSDTHDAAVVDERVGPYRILNEIGRGGMGVVYRAEDPRLDRHVALKFLPPYLTANKRAKERFVAEARAASNLDHPNICTIHDIGETADGRLYFAMAYYEGQTLDQMMRSGPSPPGSALAIVTQVARGLQHAHDAQVIHRDIKPSNILVCRNGDVKVLDFGLAKRQLSAASDPGMRLGTIAYMSPEQALGEAVDPRTDLWSLGVTLYELLKGHKPFTGQYEPAVLYEVVHEEPPPLPNEVPRGLAAIVVKLMAKKPADRFASANELISALASEVAEERSPGSTAPSAVGSRGQPSCEVSTDELEESSGRNLSGGHNLPAHLTRCIGRREEVEQIQKLLESSRLLTLTGPGGAGKTRLSLEVARKSIGRFADGVWFIRLVAISDPELVPSAIARVFDIADAPGISLADELKRVLQSKRTLLLLDNFEQVLGAAGVVEGLLRAAPELRVIVTSRAPLHITGEQEYPVPPLAVPRAGTWDFLPEMGEHSAVKLFVERARAVRLDFELTDENARFVAEICIAMDGLPLGIELAAARIKLFEPQALVRRLSKSLDLLKGHTHGHPTRHQTLRQAVAWSFELLDPPAQRLFRRLSVFAGGWTVEAVEALCADDAELQSTAFEKLAELCDHSLVRRHAGNDGEPRFSLLETIRAYALDQLGEEGEQEYVRRRHADYYRTLAEEAEPQLTGSETAKWLDRLDVEHDNIRAALRWAQETGAAEVGLAIGAALWRFWIARGHTQEGLQKLEALLALPGDENLIEARIRALNGFGTLCHYYSDFVKARSVLEECVTLSRSRGNEKGVAKALTNLAWVHSEMSEFPPALSLSAEALALHEKLGDRRGAALALNNLGWVANYIGDYDQARSYHEKSLAIRREIGDQRGIAFALTNLGWAEQYHGNLDHAAALVDEALAILKPVNDRILIGWAHFNRGQIARDQGLLDRAARIFEESLADWPAGGHRSLLAWTTMGLGAVATDIGDPERGAALLDRSLDVWNQIQSPWGAALTLWEQGRGLLLREDHEAETRIRESLRIRGEIATTQGVAECLEGLADIAMRRPNRARAIALLSSAKALREGAGLAVPPAVRGGLESRLHQWLAQIEGVELNAHAIEAAVHLGLS
ncbi:MAG: protein kinase [Acidobacteria bacterium]|nr:protein kinase [Acidobacteriota bacterium]